MTDSTPSRPSGIVDKTRRLAARGIRLAQLVAARVGATAAEAMRRKAKELEIRLDGLHKGLDIKPISDITFPTIDLAASDDPVAEIMAAPEFAASQGVFLRQSGSRALAHIVPIASLAVQPHPQSSPRPRVRNRHL